MSAVKQFLKSLNKHKKQPLKMIFNFFFILCKKDFIHSDEIDTI